MANKLLYTGKTKDVFALERTIAPAKTACLIPVRTL